jgi:hypothetical protein
MKKLLFLSIIALFVAGLFSPVARVNAGISDTPDPVNKLKREKQETSYDSFDVACTKKSITPFCGISDTPDPV